METISKKRGASIAADLSKHLGNFAICVPKRRDRSAAFNNDRPHPARLTTPIPRTLCGTLAQILDAGWHIAYQS